NISSAAACSEFWMISSVIGSLDRLVMSASLCRQVDLNVAVAVDLDMATGMDDDRCARILNDGRAVEFHTGLQPGAVIDRRLVDAFEGEIDLAAALERDLGFRAGGLALGHGQLADFGRSDEMDADHLDRRIEPVGVFA